MRPMISVNRTKLLVNEIGAGDEADPETLSLLWLAWVIHLV